MKEYLSLYLVTNRYGEEEEFLQIIEEACQSGVTLVQLREKTLSTHAYYELAKKVKQVTDRYAIPLIIDDRIDICLAVDAAGVHIGDDELPVDVAKRLIGKKWLGVSAKSLERALEAEQQGADYLGVGAIFPTQTKVVTKATSIETLKEITANVHIPVVAIGGITEDRLPVFAGTKIAGVSVISEIMQADSVSEKVQAMRKKVTQLEVKEDGK